MDVIIYKISSFTLNGSGGNKAGVVLEADGLTSKDMLRIANNVGYSETAFVMNSKIANFKVRFFTPLSEVDLCGHATIAVFNLLQQKEIINAAKSEFGLLSLHELMEMVGKKNPHATIKV